MMRGLVRRQRGRRANIWAGGKIRAVGEVSGNGIGFVFDWIDGSKQGRAGPNLESETGFTMECRRGHAPTCRTTTILSPARLTSDWTVSPRLSKSSPQCSATTKGDSTRMKIGRA